MSIIETALPVAVAIMGVTIAITIGIRFFKRVSSKWLHLMAKSKQIAKGVKKMSDTMTTALTTAFTSVKGDVMSIIETALPVGVAIMGVTIAITIGIRFFKRIASK